ncbi:HEXXH motif-containing putative peptide modification protein [Streptomyces sp. NPDC058284]|uniref:aKG-HExxH-type peptide beta-hydroxylase n=1 Tax=unclassified Streptomyces TaxID=2593676 RepID=UPI003669A19E
MLVTPDAVAARRAEDALWHATDAVLRRTGAGGSAPSRHPARKAAAHRAGAEPPPLTAPPERTASVGEDLAAVPPPRMAAGRWAVDLADPAPHLVAAVGRALASLPQAREAKTGAEGPGTAVRAWEPEQAAVLAETAERLDEVWPAMLAELHEGVRQIVLLAGRAIDGFTDFTTHGAVFVNATRLTVGRTGLPGWVRLADALVHEGTHTRCNAAAFSTPFLVSATGPGTSVMTPLRPDPRPLTGLFQQTVVLVRQTVLYRLIHQEAPLSDPQREAVAERRARLLEKAFQGVDTLGRHRTALSPAGEAVRAEAAGLLAAEAAREEARTGRLSGGRA